MNSEKLVMQGRACEEKENFEEAYRLYLEAVHMDGNGDALDSLGDMYYEGDGVSESYDKAGKYFAMAYDAGGKVKPWHMIIAGSYYQQMAEKGECPYDRAIRYYLAAVRMGTEYGYECLADIYLQMHEYEKAYECLTIPEKLNILGLYLFGRMYEEGLHVDKDPGRAVEYYEAAVDGYEEFREEYGKDMHAEMALTRLAVLKDL